MIVHMMAQGSPEWMRARAGIPTSSAFDMIVTPTGKLSTSAERYMHELLAERMLGRPLVKAITMAMAQGSQSEAEARSYYMALREQEVERVGFITNDEGTIGASPDGLVGEDGLLEIKCPQEGTHVRYLMTGQLEMTHKPQVQGQLMVTGRRWVDLLSYSPEMPHALIRIMRDEEYVALLAKHVGDFSAALEDAAAVARAWGWIRDERAE